MSDNSILTFLLIAWILGIMLITFVSEMLGISSEIEDIIGEKRYCFLKDMIFRFILYPSILLLLFLVFHPGLISISSILIFIIWFERLHHKKKTS